MTLRSTALRLLAPVALIGSLVGVAAPAHATATCNNPSFLCFWINANGSPSEMGKVSGNNPNFVNVPKSSGGNWNDVISSAYNDGNTDSVALFADAGFSGFAECITRKATSSDLSNFTNISTGLFSDFNDAASSNEWYTPQSPEPSFCNNVN